MNLEIPTVFLITILTNNCFQPLLVSTVHQRFTNMVCYRNLRFTYLLNYLITPAVYRPHSCRGRQLQRWVLPAAGVLSVVGSKTLTSRRSLAGDQASYCIDTSQSVTVQDNMWIEKPIFRNHKSVCSCCSVDIWFDNQSLSVPRLENNREVNSRS